jgi:hypothetical protein
MRIYKNKTKYIDIEETEALRIQKQKKLKTRSIQKQEIEKD